MPTSTTGTSSTGQTTTVSGQGSLSSEDLKIIQQLYESRNQRSNDPTYNPLTNPTPTPVAPTPQPTPSPGTPTVSNLNVYTSGGSSRRSGGGSSSPTISPTTNTTVSQVNTTIQRVDTTKRLPVYQDTTKPTSPFVNPFFSIEGQKERAKNVLEVERITLQRATGLSWVKRKITGKEERIQANIENPGYKKALEASANNPKTTALLLAGGYTAGASAYGAGAKAISGSAIGTLLEGSAAARFGAGVGVAALETEAIIRGGNIVSKSGYSKEDKALVESKEFRSKYAETLKRQQEGLGGNSINVFGTDKKINPRSVLFDISPAFGGRQGFIKAAREGGLSDREIKLALQERSGRSITEAGSLLNLGRFSERFGTKEVAKISGTIATEKPGYEVFKRTSFAIGRAGVIEGAGGEYTQQRLRSDKIKPLQIGVMGALGGVSAGVIGGGIAATAATGKKGTSKVIESAANILDPYESPGDTLANIQARTIGRRAKIKTVTPTITVTQPSKSGSVSFSNIIGSTPTPVKTKTPVRTQSISFNNIFKPGKPVPGSPGVPTPVDPFKPIKPTNPVIPEVPADVPISVTTPTFTTSTSIPVSSPIINIPPPLPISLPGFGGSGAARGKRRKYQNELQQGFTLFKRLL